MQLRNIAHWKSISLASADLSAMTPIPFPMMSTVSARTLAMPPRRGKGGSRGTVNGGRPGSTAERGLQPPQRTVAAAGGKEAAAMAELWRPVPAQPDMPALVTSGSPLGPSWSVAFPCHGLAVAAPSFGWMSTGSRSIRLASATSASKRSTPPWSLIQNDALVPVTLPSRRWEYRSRSPRLGPHVHPSSPWAQVGGQARPSDGIRNASARLTGAQAVSSRWRTRAPGAPDRPRLPSMRRPGIRPS